MKVAILGFGTVGSGAYEIIRDSACGLTVARILDLRVPAGYEELVTTNYRDILDDPTIQIVAEAMGGLEPAFTYVKEALRAGKHVVSANKQLLCQHYAALHEEAARAGVTLRFTPSAGGGIPWLYNLRRTRRCDTILSLRGIMNGTTNYILDAMQTFGNDFGEVLATAQALGYAERDPSADIDGLDVQRKCALSASLAFDAVVTAEDVPTLGIRTIAQEDIAYFQSLGMVCRLLAHASQGEDGAICAYVEPTLLPRAAIESSISANFNCITLVGKYTGALSFVGQGAGKYPTGQALVCDMLDAAAEIPQGAVSLTRATCCADRAPHPYYIRTGAPLPAHLIQRQDAPTQYMTQPLTPATAHALMHTIQKEDPHAFMAGVEDTNV